MKTNIALILTAFIAVMIAFTALPYNVAKGKDMTGAQNTKEAIFAGGCFWCMEAALESVAGVSKVESGYTGGHVANPTYEQVSSGSTGHFEAVRVTYDPTQITYEELLPHFWSNIDPFDDQGQFCDKGGQYRAAIFYGNEEEKQQAEWSKKVTEQHFDKSIATLLRPASTFYPAEEYHQNYYKKNPTRYKFYKWNCGREGRLDKVWGENREETAPKGFRE